MALSRGVFHPRWAAHHIPANESTFKAEVRIRRVLTEGSYDFATGATTGGTYDTFYTGPARLQKIARSVRREFAFDTADNQTVEVHVPLTALPAGKKWMSNLEVEVTACSNPGMVGAKVYVRSWVGSSNDWETLLVCAANMKDPA